jgi:UDP-glucose 4-epimerase
MGRRVLITGIGSFWGGRVAQALEQHDDVEMIVGLGVEEPQIPLERTEYVRADQSYSILSRIVRATQVDTILHTFLVVDSTRMSGRQLHEVNVIGTMNLLAAAGAPDSSVRSLVVKSSTLVYGSSYRDPAWFREEAQRTNPPGTRVERSLLEVEGYLRDFAEDNPHVAVSLLRFANVLGTDIETPITKALQLPVTPSILGFDPSVQFVHEVDVVRSIEHVMTNSVPGAYNVAGDGKLPWSEVAGICGQRLVPLPPVLTEIAASPPRRAGSGRPAARAAQRPALRTRRRQPPPEVHRVRVPLHVRRRRRELRRGQPPPPHGRPAAGLPLRARRRELLPPLARCDP